MTRRKYCIQILNKVIYKHKALISIYVKIKIRDHYQDEKVLQSKKVKFVDTKSGPSVILTASFDVK